MSTDIKAELNYNVRLYDRGYFYAREKTEADNPHHKAIFGGKSSKEEVIIKDGRGLDIKLDDTSFELVEHHTSLTTQNFYNNAEKITKVYYEEMKELLKEATGASHAVIFHHQLRSEEKSNKESLTDITSSIQGYAHGVHSDTSNYSAEELFWTLVPGTSDPERYSKGRFMYVNVWRNISDTPIENNHLAMCDERSVVKPDDYLSQEFHGVRYDLLQHTLSNRNSHLHEWYYFSKMKKNEAIIFKQWDSDTTKPSRLCFHTAFSDPNAPSNAATRESIEVRALVFFPDHTPNTCPPKKVEEITEITGDEKVDKAVGLVLNVVSNMNFWPTAGLWWVKMSLRKGKSGVELIAKTLVDDKMGHLGLKDASEETKKQIVDALLTKTDFEKKLKVSFSLVEHRVSFSSLSFNVSIPKATFITVFSMAAGFGLCMLMNKTRFRL